MSVLNINGINGYQVAHSIKFAICKSLDMRSHVAEIVNNGNAIRIYGKRNETNIYVRIETYQGRFIVNFSSVALDESLQRQGIFTDIIKNVSNVNIVNYIKIGSVVTPQMKQFCITRGFKAINDGDFIKQVR